MQRKLTLQHESLKLGVTEFLGTGTLDLPALSRNGISREKFDYREIGKGTAVHTRFENVKVKIYTRSRILLSLPSHGQAHQDLGKLNHLAQETRLIPNRRTQAA